MSVFQADRRSSEPEWMDEETVPFEDFRACLADLAAVNRLTLGHRPTLSFLERLRRAEHLPPGRPVRILDVGSGYGDTLRAVAGWASRRGIEVDLLGIDLNPWSTRAAREATPPELPLRFETADVFTYRPEAPPDLILSALFTHHLSDDALVRFVAWSEATAMQGWFVNDLERSRLSHAGFTALSALMRWHRFVRHDGPVSIARSFLPEDWRRTVRGAGLPEEAVRIERQVPYRLCVSRVKP